MSFPSRESDVFWPTIGGTLALLLGSYVLLYATCAEWKWTPCVTTQRGTHYKRQLHLRGLPRSLQVLLEPANLVMRVIQPEYAQERIWVPRTSPMVVLTPTASQ